MSYALIWFISNFEIGIVLSILGAVQNNKYLLISAVVPLTVAAIAYIMHRGIIMWDDKSPMRIIIGLKFYSTILHSHSSSVLLLFNGVPKSTVIPPSGCLW